MFNGLRQGQRKLKWSNLTTFDDGLSKTIIWYKNYFNILKSKIIGTYIKNNEKFLPEQYRKDKKLKIKHNYLSEQFSDHEIILKKISNVVKNNDLHLERK